MVSTGRCSSHAASEAATTAISMPGQVGRKRRCSEDQRRRRRRRCARAAGLRVGSAPRQRRQLGQQRARLGAGQRQPAQVLQLAGQDGDGDAAGEAHRDRMGDVADQRAQPRAGRASVSITPDSSTVSSRPSRPNLRDRRRHQHDEGAGRSADLVSGCRPAPTPESRRRWRCKARAPAKRPRRRRIAMESGRATMATVSAASRSLRNWARR